MKKLLKLFAVITAILTCTTIFSACSKKSDTDAVKEKGFLMVGVTVYDPMDYIGSSDDWEGFDADLARLFGEELDVDVRFTIINWNQKVMELKSGVIDLIWNGMTYSDELAGEIDLSVPYAKNFQCAVVLNTSDITTLEGIKNTTVAVEKGSAGDDVATEELGITPNRLTAQVDALNEVVAGTSKVAIVDYTLAQSVVGKNAYANLKVIDVSTVKFADEVFSVGARKGSDLTGKLNAFLKAKYADGTLAELSAKYDNKIVLNSEDLGK
ncbi:MAG: transporter substrate-binding domain-containing protein [Clostridia bacterium]|nr:transporter substrate-binding domain-containing protein [Clostridia bacterium]